MTLPQIVSLISTILLTVVALIVGIQLIMVLKELKYSLMKINRTLDTASDTIEKISQPAIGFFAILEGLKEGGKIMDTVSSFLGRDKPKPPVDIDAYDESV